MRFIIEGRTFFVQFLHLDNGKKGKKFQRWTECNITSPDKVNKADEEGEDEHVNSGIAHCNNDAAHGDEFTKARGRKFAFERALSIFDRPTRTKFWKAYWDYFEKLDQARAEKSPLAQPYILKRARR